MPLTDKGIGRLQPKEKSYLQADPQTPGHFIRVLPTGGKSFVVVARAPTGKQVWATVGRVGVMSLDEARELARSTMRAIRRGEDRAGPEGFRTVADKWFKRHVEGRGLRTAGDIRRYLDREIIPAFEKLPFRSIRRGDITRLLDKIEDEAGPVAADKALAHISKLCAWYATRHDDYTSPVVKGMRRSNPKERARDRILSDDELRAVWAAAETSGTYGAFIRILLLTAQRSTKVRTMKWADLEGGVWTISTEDREKGNAGKLRLPPEALEIIEAQPCFADNPYVFAGRGDGPIGGLSKYKDALDAKAPIAHWTIHDLRRTSRSLMSRAGVGEEIAERVLGHAQEVVVGIYNRHDYADEKADALRKLATLIGTIFGPTSDNTVRLAG
jgi:integrase